MARRSACPCGSGATFADCCEPILAGTPAPTAERLMRSRYTAFVVGDEEHLLASWHPATRPEQVEPDPDLAWTGLEILATEAGGADDAKGVVEFRASYRRLEAGGAEPGALHETSRFSRREGRWVYVRGRVHEG